EAGGCERLDERDLRVGRHDRLLVLEPVARADLDDADGAVGLRHPSSSSSTRTCPATTASPSRTRTAVTVPAEGVRTLVCIFIASNTTIASPAATTSPTPTWTVRTFAGIGAVSDPPGGGKLTASSSSSASRYAQPRYNAQPPATTTSRDGAGVGANARHGSRSSAAPVVPTPSGSAGA